MLRLYYDIKAFLILRKEVRKHRVSPDWAKYNLRHDWLYRIYTVINPLPGDKGDDAQMVEMKALDRAAPINRYIMSMGLGEIVSLSMEKIPDTDSYLIVYYQIYKWFSPWRVISRLALLTAAGLTINYFWKNIISLFS
jgi:hypothetical protein